MRGERACLLMLAAWAMSLSFSFALPVGFAACSRYLLQDVTAAESSGKGAAAAGSDNNISAQDPLCTSESFHEFAVCVLSC